MRAAVYYADSDLRIEDHDDIPLSDVVTGGLEELHAGRRMTLLLDTTG